MALYLPGNGLHRLGILTKGNATLLYIGAGNVDLQKVHRLITQPLHHFHIIFRGLSAHIDHDLCVKLFQIGDIPLHKHVDARVLEPDGIDHASVCLRDPWSRVAGPRHIRDPLGHHRSQKIQIHKLPVLLPRAKGS